MAGLRCDGGPGRRGVICDPQTIHPHTLPLAGGYGKCIVAPFVKGQSGNPAGRPIGARNKVNRDLPRNVVHFESEEALVDGGGDLTREVMAQAKSGTAAAMKVCFDRLLPMGRNRPMTITLPGVDTPDYIGAAVTVVLEELSEGELTMTEANSLIAFIDRTARLLAYRAELAERTEVEAQTAANFARIKAQLGIADNNANTIALETMTLAAPVKPSAAVPAEKINKNTDIAPKATAPAAGSPIANNNALASAVAPGNGKKNSTLDRLLSSTSALSHAAAMGSPKLPATKAA